MTEDAERKSADPELISAVWQEARDLIKRLEGSSVQRLAVEAGDTRIEIERGIPAGTVAVPAALGAAAPSEDGAGAPGEPAGHPIRAPLVGTFYRSSQPGAEPFVEVGDAVELGQTVAIVEAMKLMNQVQADVAGTVREILVSDGDWVEFEQVLITLEPADAEEE